MEPIRLALLGCGDVAQRDYLPEFHRIQDRARIVAVCGRTPTRAQATAEKYGVPVWTTDYKRMLAEPAIDAVINLTPIQLHAETNLAALQAGKHVYSEIPLATSLSDARRLRDEAGQRELKLVAAPCVMIFPQVRYAQSLLSEGAVDAVYSARGHGHGGVPPWRGYTSDPTPFFTTGGGPARDMGVYPLHALTGLLGPVRRVTALASRTRESFVVEDGPARGKVVHLGEDDNWHILLDFGAGRLAHVAANNCVQDTRAPELEVFGLQGTIALNLIDVSAPVEVKRAGHGWETVTLPRTGRAAGPDHLLGIEHLLDCLQHDREPVLSAQHALHVIEILEKAAASAQRGETLAIESTF